MGFASGCVGTLCRCVGNRLLGSGNILSLPDKEKAQGTLKYGSALVPFINRFPQDTKLYQLMTTRPGEGKFARGRD